MSGAAVRVGNRYVGDGEPVLRAGALFCAHCSDGAGPVVAHAGVEYRW